jgi:predicted flap endonuclease-1-like 5' DNA nuclease
MSWLLAQIWLELLIAAAFGGAVGVALHILYRKWKIGLPVEIKPDHALPGPDSKTRVAELEDKLIRTEAQLDDLHRKSGIPPLGSHAQPPEGSLAWRNRHLESRIRFLEGKLADLETESGASRLTEDQNDEATRLRWRNRYLEGRVKYLEEELVRTGGLTPGTTILAQADTGRAQPSDEDKPELFDSPRDGQADDLKMISGIGPKLEQKLNSIGIWHYAQVASWTQKEVDWVDAAISFRGRVEREKWIPQAVALLERYGTGNLESASEVNGA